MSYNDGTDVLGSLLVDEEDLADVADQVMGAVADAGAGPFVTIHVKNPAAVAKAKSGAVGSFYRTWHRDH